MCSERVAYERNRLWVMGETAIMGGVWSWCSYRYWQFCAPAILVLGEVTMRVEQIWESGSMARINALNDPQEQLVEASRYRAFQRLTYRCLQGYLLFWWVQAVRRSVDWGGIRSPAMLEALPPVGFASLGLWLSCRRHKRIQVMIRAIEDRIGEQRAHGLIHRYVDSLTKLNPGEPIERLFVEEERCSEERRALMNLRLEELQRGWQAWMVDGDLDEEVDGETYLAVARLAILGEIVNPVAIQSKQIPPSLRVHYEEVASMQALWSTLSQEEQDRFRRALPSGECNGSQAACRLMTILNGRSQLYLIESADLLCEANRRAHFEHRCAESSYWIRGVLQCGERIAQWQHALFAR